MGLRERLLVSGLRGAQGVSHPFLSSESSDGFFAVTRVYGLPKAGGNDLTTIPGHTYPCRTPQAGAARVSLADFGAVRATLGIVPALRPQMRTNAPPTSSPRRSEAPNPGSADRRQGSGRLSLDRLQAATGPPQAPDRQVLPRCRGTRRQFDGGFGQPQAEIAATATSSARALAVTPSQKSTAARSYSTPIRNV